MNDAPFFRTNAIICKRTISKKTKQRLSGIYFNRTKIDSKRNVKEIFGEWKNGRRKTCRQTGIYYCVDL